MKTKLKQFFVGWKPYGKKLLRGVAALLLLLVIVNQVVWVYRSRQTYTAERMGYNDVTSEDVLFLLNAPHTGKLRKELLYKHEEQMLEQLKSMEFRMYVGLDYWGEGLYRVVNWTERSHGWMWIYVGEDVYLMRFFENYVAVQRNGRFVGAYTSDTYEDLYKQVKEYIRLYLR